MWCSRSVARNCYARLFRASIENLNLDCRCRRWENMGRNPRSKNSKSFPGDLPLLSWKSLPGGEESWLRWERALGTGTGNESSFEGGTIASLKNLNGRLGAIPSNSLGQSGGKFLVWLLTSRHSKSKRRIFSLRIWVCFEQKAADFWMWD